MKPIKKEGEGWRKTKKTISKQEMQDHVENI